jgi:cell division GTPase FtsZ
VSGVAETDRPAFGLPGRIQSPNSKPRAIAVVGIGEGGASIARELAKAREPNVEVHVLARTNAGEEAVNAIKAGGGDLNRDLSEADMIFLIARKGDDVSLAPVVARIAHGRNHPVTALYIVRDAMPADEEDETLKTLRSAVEMLVVVSDESYIPAMLSQLCV